MDPGSPSPFSKLANLSARGSVALQFEEVPLNTLSLGQWDPGRDAEVASETQASEKEIESVVDGVIPTAVTQTNHKSAAEKQRFSTLGYQKKHKNSVVPEFASVSKTASGSTKSRGTLQVLFSQGLSEKTPTPEEQAQLESLKQTLEIFPLPALPDWKGGGGQGEGGREGGVTDVTLEESWTQIVHSHLTMSKKQRLQQEALWEFIHTELSYIRKLTIVNDLVIAALVNLQKNGFLSEVTPQLLFSNLPSILHAHRLFWHEVLLPLLQEVRETGKPFDPVRLEKGCMQFNERFAPYLQYCWEEKRIIDFTHKQASNPQFQAYLRWVETCPLVCRMRLGEMQAKPHLRITKYHLLLKAILTYTEDPIAQYALRRMLTSVNSFVDSINEYLTTEEDKLALSLSAQRVEAYEVVETTNVEIDEHVKKLCRFDLTSPVQGLRDGDIRKLLLEETLKIKEKKDKVEVVLLLFSDVLLVTKAQKKSEKLKVARPPLALERTHCAALKDGCSLVLVEMSEFGCPVNVHTIFAPNPESCSALVSTIHKTQESLAAMREREVSHRMGEDSVRRFSQIDKQVFPPSEVNEDRKEQINQSEVELFSEPKTKKEASKKLSENGTLPLTEAEKNPLNQSKNVNSLLVGRNIPSSQSAHGNFETWRSKEQDSHSGKKDVVISKGEAKEDSSSAQKEFTENVHPGIKERRVTWNHMKAKPSPSTPQKPEVSNESQSNASHSPLMGKRQDPEIAPSKSAPSLSVHVEEFNKDTSSWESISKESLLQGKFKLSDQHSRRDSSSSQSGDDFFKESWTFSRKLNSKHLRRRRPMGANSPYRSVCRNGSLDFWDTVHAFETNSFAKGDLESLRRTHHALPQKSHSHLGLDLRAMRGNRAALLNGAARRESPEPGTISEPELPVRMPEQNSQRSPKLKTQRRVSIPDIVIQAASPEAIVPQSSELERHPSRVAILERVRERAAGLERGGPKAGRSSTRSFILDVSPSASRPTSPALSPSGVDVDVLRTPTPTVAHEGGVGQVEEQGSDKGRKYSASSPFPPGGASVDWFGWCVDDEEVKVSLAPEEGEGQAAAEDGRRMSRTLTLSDLQRIGRQEDGECSEV